MIITPDSQLLPNAKLPSSKSFLNRILILASLVDDVVVIDNFAPAEDVEDLVELLLQIGIKVEYPYKETIKICNSFPACEVRSEKVIELRSGAGGTTNRFLLAMLSLGQNRYHLNPHPRLLERPMQQMWDLFDQCKVSIELQPKGWPIIQGPIKLPEQLQVDTEQTSQMASAFAMLKVVRDFNLKLEDNFASQRYFDLTMHLVERILKGDRCFRAPVDFSSLGYQIAYGVHIAPITISGILAIDSFQPDSQLIKILKNVGANIQQGCSGLKIIPSRINGFDLDCSGIPDLVPTLVFLASDAATTSNFYGVKNLKFKESNRLVEILKLLKLFEIRGQYLADKDCLEIEPATVTVSPIKYSSVDDHRIALLAMLLMYKNSGGEILNFECVRKSFPGLLK